VARNRASLPSRIALTASRPAITVARESTPIGNSCLRRRGVTSDWKLATLRLCVEGGSGGTDGRESDGIVDPWWLELEAVDCLISTGERPPATSAAGLPARAR